MDQTVNARLALASLHIQKQVGLYYRQHGMPLVWSQISLGAVRRAKHSEATSDRILDHAVSQGFVRLYISLNRAKCLLPMEVLPDSPAHVEALYKYDNRDKHLPAVRKGNQARIRKSRMKAVKTRMRAQTERHLRQLDLIERGLLELLHQLTTYKQWAMAPDKTKQGDTNVEDYYQGDSAQEQADTCKDTQP